MSTVAFRKVAELSNKENVELKKVELSAEMVELNVAKDIINVMKAAQKEWSAGDGLEQRIKDTASDAISAYKQARIKYNEAFKNYEKLESDAKSLGLEVPKNVKELGVRAKSFIDEGAEKIKNLQKIR